MLVDEVKGRLMTPSPSLLAHEEWRWKVWKIYCRHWFDRRDLEL